MFIFQSVMNLDNVYVFNSTSLNNGGFLYFKDGYDFVINNLIVNTCYATNYGGDFYIESKPGYNITINNLITANSEAGKGGEMISGSGSGTGTTQNENGAALVMDVIEIQEELNGDYAFMLTDLNFGGKNFYDISLSSNESFMFWSHSEAIENASYYVEFNDSTFEKFGTKVIVLENVTNADSILINNNRFKSLNKTILDVSFVLSDIDGSVPSVVIQNGKFHDNDHVGATVH